MMNNKRQKQHKGKGKGRREANKITKKKKEFTVYSSKYRKFTLFSYDQLLFILLIVFPHPCSYFLEQCYSIRLRWLIDRTGDRYF